MMLSKSIICAFLIAGIASIGSVIAIYEYADVNMTPMFVIEPAMAQQPTLEQQQELAKLQERTLRFPPGQYFYYSTAQIDTISKGFVDGLQNRSPAFNINTDNAVARAIIPMFGGWLHQEVTPHFTDVSLAFRYITLMLNAGYDATAPYHATAVGVYSRIDNLPSGSSDIRGMNIASFHAAYQLLMKFDPGREAQWDRMMTSNGLDPDDTSGLNLNCWQSTPHQLTSPVAIGNLAGKCVWEGRVNDGFNQSGEKTDGYPFMDTTGYKSVNSANKLKDPSRWQPLIFNAGNGEYVGQQFVTPQWANTEPYTDIDPRKIRAPAPTKSNHVNTADYREQADEVLNAVANLTDRKKIIAEYFDNKARGTLFFPAVKAFNHETGQPKNTMEFWQLDFLLHIAEFDAGIVAWQEKARYDTVRPVTAIKYLYGTQSVPTYDDKDPDTPSMISAKQWKSYLNTGNHPEYPSATTCFCAAEAQVWRHWLSTNGTVKDTIPLVNGKLGFSGILHAKSSIYERGITPANPVNVTFATWTEFVDECAESRIYSGVHFRPAVEHSVDLCTGVGDVAYDYFQSLLNGTAAPRGGPDQEQSKDPLLRSHFTGRR